MIILIAAIAKNNAIGKNNRLLWHLPNDLKRFKKITLGHPIIMGRKTFESFPNPLPNRTHIIVSRNFETKDGIVVNAIEDAVTLAKKHPKTFIIGGAEIYKEMIPFADQLELTEVHHAFEGDTFFPEINFLEWEETKREEHSADENHLYPYSFVSYKRIVKT